MKAINSKPDEARYTESLLKVPQVAELLGVRPQWVYDRLTDMPHFRVGRYVRFRLSDLEEWLEAQRQGPGSGGRQ